jgi:hypothetical protein
MLAEACRHAPSGASSDAGRAAALALTLGRAGRSESLPALERAQDALRSRPGLELEVEIVELARALLLAAPPAEVSRADLGYRVRTPSGELYVEDPLAAHWHLLGRWGPPIRPDRERAPRLARGAGAADQLLPFLLEGGIALVVFPPEPGHGILRGPTKPVPPLYLCCAGFARDPALGSLVRWSRVSSLGAVDDRASPADDRPGRAGRRIGLQIRGGPLAIFPSRASVPTRELESLLARLLKRARPC